MKPASLIPQHLDSSVPLFPQLELCQEENTIGQFSPVH